MIKVLHNNTCSKSRAVLLQLDENMVPFEIIDIAVQPLSRLEIKTLLKKLNLPAASVIRKTEKVFEENFAGKKLSEEEIIDALVDFPELLERPILIKENIAMICRPVENVRFFVD